MIEVHEGQDAAAWDEFVLAAPQASYFHLAAWQNIYREVYGLRPFALVAQDAGAVVGVLPLCAVHAWPARAHVTSLPGGWCAAKAIRRIASSGRTLVNLEPPADRLCLGTAGRSSGAG
ncbi:MAG: hypothetical protein WBV59_13175 [Anaerolineae bacterium]